MRRSSQLAQLGVARNWSSGVFGQSLLGVSPSVLEFACLKADARDRQQRVKNERRRALLTPRA
jgi:hypothetical protein